ncbi:MAG: 3-hydroxyacyl-CoA dehydrogenase family protein, partial [bacterium]|nr:3-hydroxyacyl-CoA dehydrogenase family protein [bacterium]
AALIREALALVESGVATPQDVDRVITTSIGRRWAVAGVFEVTEIAGLDLKRAILSELLPAISSSPEVPAVLTEKVDRGEIGVKSGKGFYEWTPESAAALRARIARALIEIERWK